MKMIVIASAAAAMAVGGVADAQQAAVPQAPALGPTVGNIAQVGIGSTRIGSTTGLIGGRGTPTTVVGVNVALKGSPVSGSAATLTVPAPQR